MNTLSMRLRYRPLRLGWCVQADDLSGFRGAVAQSFALWGGRYNPIIPIDEAAHAEDLVRLYRVDALIAASDTPAVHAFIKSQKHLPWPLWSRQIFVHEKNGPARCALLDLFHPLARLESEARPTHLPAEPGIEFHEWDGADPLADVFACTYGVLPPVTETGVDYRGAASLQLVGQRHLIPNGGELAPDNPGRWTLAKLNRAYLEPHYAVLNTWDRAGVYVGHADDMRDLIHFWNLRAADVELMFHDPRHADRTAAAEGDWTARVQQSSRRAFPDTGVAIWSRDDGPEFDAARFGEGAVGCSVDRAQWNGRNLKAPIMHFGERSALASLNEREGKVDAAFALTDRPFAQSLASSDQRYVLSIDPGIGLFGNERLTLHAPFLPALNEYLGRNLHYDWRAARAEPDSVGLVTRVSTTDVRLRALDVGQLTAEVFRSVGIDAAPSKPGLICSTLIQQMGGLSGCRVFKIGGVRALIEKHRPDQSFSRSAAKQTIMGQGDIRPIADYQSLYIEPRPHGTGLTGDAVLSYLLDRSVFRAGLKFDCPNCRLEFWRSLDDAGERVRCEYCGSAFNAASQLRDKDWAFRRSGLFGRDDHQEGAIPVVLTLQQLMQMQGGGEEAFFTTALTLRPAGAAIRDCETDFSVVAPQVREGRIQLVIGECKSHSPISADDVRNLIEVADAFPTDRFDTFIAFAKLTKFTPDEIALASAVNTQHRRRLILLTDRELEPYFVYDRTAEAFDIDRSAVSFDDMAKATHDIFIEPRPRGTSEFVALA